NRHFLTSAETNPAAEKYQRHQTRRAAERLTFPGRRAKAENALPLEKEVALLREEEAEPRQVHLLFVFLDLRKVGVIRHIGGQALGQPVFHVESGIAGEIVRHGGAGLAVRGHRGDPVRFEFEIAALWRDLEADERGGGGQLVDAATAVRGRNAGEI